MKTKVFAILALLFMPFAVFAQAVTDATAAIAASATPVASTGSALIDQNTSDFLKLLIDSLGGLKGASSLVIAGVVVQLLIKAMSLPAVGKLFSEAQGWLKLVIVTGLTLVSGVIGLMTAGGLTLGAALVHSTTLAALMVFGNQIIQHFFPPKT